MDGATHKITSGQRSYILQKRILNAEVASKLTEYQAAAVIKRFKRRQLLRQFTLLVLCLAPPSAIVHYAYEQHSKTNIYALRPGDLTPWLLGQVEVIPLQQNNSELNRLLAEKENLLLTVLFPTQTKATDSLEDLLSDFKSSMPDTEGHRIVTRSRGSRRTNVRTSEGGVWIQGSTRSESPLRNVTRTVNNDLFQRYRAYIRQLTTANLDAQLADLQNRLDRDIEHYRPLRSRSSVGAQNLATFNWLNDAMKPYIEELSMIVQDQKTPLEQWNEFEVRHSAQIRSLINQVKGKAYFPDIDKKFKTKGEAQFILFTQIGSKSLYLPLTDQAGRMPWLQKF